MSNVQICKAPLDVVVAVMVELVLTRCGLGDPGIESWWGQDFSCVQTPAFCAEYTGSFPG